MGYLCPVCAEPFADSHQCANHLAVTAILHGADHETWLAATVDDWLDKQDDSELDTSADSWESIPRAVLAELVADRAERTESHDHPGDHTHPVDSPTETQATETSPFGETPTRDAVSAGQPAITESQQAVETLDADAQAVLREARELTERMQQRGPDDERNES